MTLLWCFKGKVTINTDSCEIYWNVNYATKRQHQYFYFSYFQASSFTAIRRDWEEASRPFDEFWGVSCMASSRSCWCHPHLCLPSTKCRTSSFEGGGCRAGHNITMEIGNWAYSLRPGCHHMLDQRSPPPINKFHGCSGPTQQISTFQAT